ncbi:TPR-like protein [Lentithecium fluviatile CBS 122367]|uniref:TPR-like protein n=1 Tax=Lentithecium fluviatile CBS 122367 TaxID=1168545 RepID=A0A6G1IPE4_9PLEO|nr:TPR-like protein [Lentithecium fluviatile CBS 122367]
MVFQHLGEKHPDAAALLRLFSLFEPEAIPIFDNWYREEPRPVIPANVTPPKPGNILTVLARICCCCFSPSRRSVPLPIPLTNVDKGSSATLDIFKDTNRLNAAVAKLVDLNLARRLDKRVLWIHDLTRFTISQTIAEEDQTLWLLSALRSIYHAYPLRDNTLKERLTVDIYLPQAIKLVGRAQTTSINVWEYAPLMALCAQSMCKRGKYSQAIEWFNIILPEYQKNLGERHRRTASILHDMAVTHHQASDLDIAEATYHTAWQLRSEVCEEHSLETLETMNNLAACIERQGRLKEGEAIFAKTYEGLQQKLGLADVRTIAAAHNLALCYNNQGRVAEAERLYREALKVSEDTFGPEDPGTLKTLGNLAVTVDQSGRLFEAEALYSRALASYKKLLGYDDMLTLRVRSNVSGLYRQLGRFELAETTIREAINAVLTIFGPDHFHSAIALYDLGEVLQAKGSLDEAERYLTLSFERMGTNSAQHPLAIRIIDALGILYRELGDFPKSSEKTALAYERNKALLGEDDPFTLVSANSRAEYLHSERYYQQALELYNDCLRGFKKLLPAGHPHILMVLNNLGRLSWLMESSNPLVFFREAYDGFNTLVGPDNPCTLTVAMNIARSEFAAGHVNIAQESLSAIRNRFKAVLGNFHPLLSATDFHLGIVLASQNQVNATKAARDHFQDAADCFVKAFGVQHPNYIISVCMLIQMLRRLEEFDDAEAYQSVIDTQINFTEAHRFIALGKADLRYVDLTAIQPSAFDWTATISLPFGEHVRLRWGRKNVWREPEQAALDS